MEKTEVFGYVRVSTAGQVKGGVRFAVRSFLGLMCFGNYRASVDPVRNNFRGNGSVCGRNDGLTSVTASLEN